MSSLRYAPVFAAVVMVSQWLWSIPASPSALLDCGPREAEHLSELPARGLHVLSARNSNSGDELPVEVFVDGLVQPQECNYRQELHDIYTEHRPEKVGATDALLEEYTSDEPALLSAVQRKYGLALSDDCGRVDTEAPPLIKVNTVTGAGGIDVWLLDPVRAIVAVARTRQHKRLKDQRLLSSSALKELAERPGLNRWSFFTPHGTAIPNEPAEILRAFRECGTVYLFEGGAFMWPGIRVGHSRVGLDSGDGGNVSLTTRSLSPLVFTIDPMLTDAEAQQIIAEAEPQMERSLVELASSGQGELRQGRTSTQTVLGSGLRSHGKKSPSTDAIEMRSHHIAKLPISHGESLSILRYRQGERYQNHQDFFEPPQLLHGQAFATPEVTRITNGGRRNRLATLIWYL